MGTTQGYKRGISEYTLNLREHYVATRLDVAHGHWRSLCAVFLPLHRLFFPKQ